MQAWKAKPVAAHPREVQKSMQEDSKEALFTKILEIQISYFFSLV